MLQETVKRIEKSTQIEEIQQCLGDLGSTCPFVSDVFF